MGLEIRVLTYDNHRNVAGFNRKMPPQPFSLNKCISNGNTDIKSTIIKKRSRFTFTHKDRILSQI